MNPVETYICEAPKEHYEALTKLRNILRDTLTPLGYEECISYGMIGYVVPFSLYPAGYHCDTSLPLPFTNIASRKSGISLYHMGVGADPDLLKWWQEAYVKENNGKLDMGVGCIRFKKIDQIPYDLIRDLMQKISANEWISLYEKRYRNKN
jgi:hypothetical protein